jgi:hypothetical protein
MTHTLHRLGSLETLQKDFVVMAMTAKGFNEEGSIPKLKEYFKIILKHKPVNYGEVMAGSRSITSVSKIMDSFNISSVPHGVFTTAKQVEDVLKDLKKADLGLSIVVSGVRSEVEKCCRNAGLRAHTVEHSLGIWGKKQKLSQTKILEITNMCGHSMISTRLAEREIDEVKAKKKTPEEAVEVLSCCCRCSVFNPERAAGLIKGMVDE